MAIWQFSFDLVPESELHAILDAGTTALRTYDDAPVPSDEVSGQFIKELESLLPKAYSTPGVVEAWGDERGIIVQRWHEGTLRIRVHLGNYRHPFSNQLAVLLEIARKLRLRVLLLDDLECLDPSVEVLEDAMTKSRAYKWFEDPEARLRDSEDLQSG